MNNKNDLKAEKTLCNCTFVYIEVIRVDNVPEVVEELNDQLIMKKNAQAARCTDGMESTRLNFVHLHQGGRRGGLALQQCTRLYWNNIPLPFRQHGGGSCDALGYIRTTPPPLPIPCSMGVALVMH